MWELLVLLPDKQKAHLVPKCSCQCDTESAVFMSLVFSLLSSRMFSWFLLFYLNTEEKGREAGYSTKGQTILQSWCRHTGPPAQLYFWAISDAMKVTSGRVVLVLAFEWKPWLRLWAEQPAVFPSEESTVSQLLYLTCHPDLSGVLFCFYIVNNSASWVSGDSYRP